jgi:hypothetical protein
VAVGAGHGYYANARITVFCVLLLCSNVINATGIRPHPLLSHVRLVVQQDPAALLKAVDLLPGACIILVMSVMMPTHVLLIWKPVHFSSV